MKVLVAGGAGYIGSHICVELLQANHEVIVIDDFSNSKPEVLGYIKDITGKDVKFYEFNILDEKKTEQVFIENEIDAVIHCASLYDTGVEVTKDDSVISLSTCTKSGEKRFVVHAKKLY